jgi:hypothetical protein
MSLTQVTGPYPIFTDLDGSPLDDGYLYIGDQNDDPETNPIQVFWDSALTIPATQPIRTNSGYAWRNGTPGLLYTAGPFSITIRNKRNEFVLYSPLGYGFDPASVSASVVKNDFVGDGVDTTFTLSATPSTVLATNAFINGVYQEKDSYSLFGNVITFSVAPPLGSSIEIMTNETGVINSGNATAISYTAGFAGATAQTVQTKLEQYVSVKDFGAVCDGVADDTAAVQAAVNYCASFGFYWPALVIPGRCKLTASVNINRPVDNTKTEFRIIGQGPGAGFYATGTVTMFDSTIAMASGSGTAPVSEFVTFENINFEASSFFDDVFVISRKFLRIKFLNCFFWLTRCQASDTYCQTLYFVACNIRNTRTNFINTAGLYDVVFDSCIIENGQTVVRSIDASYGTSGLRFIGCVIEGISLSSIVVATGVAGFDLVGCHLEANFSPEFNFFGGGLTNGSVTVTGNYIYNPAGATFYYGPTTAVFSAGNTAFPSVLHSNAVQIVNLISSADNASGGVSDATTVSIINGVYRAGNTSDVWSSTGNQISKSAAGNFGINVAAQATSKLTVAGADQTASNFAGSFLDSNGNIIAAFRNDRRVTFPALANYANDAAAAAGGIPVGYLYRNGSVVQVRVT